MEQTCYEEGDNEYDDSKNVETRAINRKRTNTDNGKEKLQGINTSPESRDSIQEDKSPQLICEPTTDSSQKITSRKGKVSPEYPIRDTWTSAPSVSASIQGDDDSDDTGGVIGRFFGKMIGAETPKIKNKQRSTITDSDDGMEVEQPRPNRKRKGAPSPGNDDKVTQEKNKQRAMQSPNKEIIDVDKIPDNPIRKERSTGASTGENPVAEDFSSDVSNTSTGKKKKTVIRDRLRFCPKIRDLRGYRLDNKPTEELVKNLTEWMEDSDLIRVECTNSIQGTKNGNMKDRFAAVIEGIRIMGERIEEKGDTAYLYSKQIELTKELDSCKKEIRKLKDVIQGYEVRLAQFCNIGGIDQATSTEDLATETRISRYERIGRVPSY